MPGAFQSTIRQEPAPLSFAIEWERRLLLALVVADLALVGAYLLLFVFTTHGMKLFDLNREDNLPSWWSSVQLLLAGQLFGIVAWQAWRLGREWLPLAAFASVLVFLSMDEGASVHEAIGYRIDQMTGGLADSLFERSGTWFLVIGIPFVLGMLWLFYRLADRFGEVAGTRGRLLAALLFLFVGALGIEGASNLIGTTTAASRVGYHLSVALEEGCEMVGGSLFVWAGFLFLIRHPDMRGVARSLGPRP